MLPTPLDFQSITRQIPAWGLPEVPLRLRFLRLRALGGRRILGVQARAADEPQAARDGSGALRFVGESGLPAGSRLYPHVSTITPLRVCRQPLAAGPARGTPRQPSPLSQDTRQTGGFRHFLRAYVARQRAIACKHSWPRQRVAGSQATGKPSRRAACKSLASEQTKSSVAGSSLHATKAAASCSASAPRRGCIRNKRRARARTRSRGLISTHVAANDRSRSSL